MMLVNLGEDWSKGRGVSELEVGWQLGDQCGIAACLLLACCGSLSQLVLVSCVARNFFLNLFQLQGLLGQVGLDLHDLLSKQFAPFVSQLYP
jgi:hypothetical protein